MASSNSEKYKVTALTVRIEGGLTGAEDTKALIAEKQEQLELAERELLYFEGMKTALPLQVETNGALAAMEWTGLLDYMRGKGRPVDTVFEPEFLIENAMAALDSMIAERGNLIFSLRLKIQFLEKVADVQGKQEKPNKDGDGDGSQGGSSGMTA